jgi:hypothetical protein
MRSKYYSFEGRRQEAGGRRQEIGSNEQLTNY